MSSILDFTLSIRPTKKPEVEKYDYAVLTMNPAPDQPNKKYVFSLNKAAMELLNNPKEVAFSFKSNGELLDKPIMVNPGELEIKESFQVYANNTFHNQKLHRLLCEFYDLEPTEEWEFTLTLNPEITELIACTVDLLEFAGLVEDKPIYLSETQQFLGHKYEEVEAIADVIY